MTFEFGRGDVPTKKQGTKEDTFPQLTEYIQSITPALNGNPDSGWYHIEFSLENLLQSDIDREIRCWHSRIVLRLKKAWDVSLFRHEVRDRPEQADNGRCRIFFRVIRK